MADLFDDFALLNNFADTAADLVEEYLQYAESDLQAAMQDQTLNPREREDALQSCMEHIQIALKMCKNERGLLGEIDRLRIEIRELHQIVGVLFPLAHQCARKELLLRRYHKLETDTEGNLPVIGPIIPKSRK